MIENTLPLSMSEALEVMKNSPSETTEIEGFVKKFVKIDSEKAKELREKLYSLDLLKLKEEHIVQIINILPEDAEDLNKIFSGIGLDEDETKKILDTIKEYL